MSRDAPPVCVSLLPGLVERFVAVDGIFGGCRDDRCRLLPLEAEVVLDDVVVRGGRGMARAVSYNSRTRSTDGSFGPRTLDRI